MSTQKSHRVCEQNQNSCQKNVFQTCVMRKFSISSRGKLKQEGVKQIFISSGTDLAAEVEITSGRQIHRRATEGLHMEDLEIRTGRARLRTRRPAEDGSPLHMPKRIRPETSPQRPPLPGTFSRPTQPFQLLHLLVFSWCLTCTRWSRPSSWSWAR